MKIKDSSVKLDRLHESMKPVLEAVDAIWKQFGHEAVITSGNEITDEKGDFVHSVGSLHYYGKALDFRNRYFNAEVKRTIVTNLRNVLGNNYDVVLHTTHVHVEFDPKD